LELRPSFLFCGRELVANEPFFLCLRVFPPPLIQGEKIGAPFSPHRRVTSPFFPSSIPSSLGENGEFLAAISFFSPPCAVFHSFPLESPVQESVFFSPEGLLFSSPFVFFFFAIRRTGVMILFRDDPSFLLTEGVDSRLRVLSYILFAVSALFRIGAKRLSPSFFRVFLF